MRGLHHGEHAGAERGGFAALAGEGLHAEAQGGAVVLGGVGSPDVTVHADVAYEGVEDGAVGVEAVLRVDVFPRGDDGGFGVHE